MDNSLMIVFPDAERYPGAVFIACQGDNERSKVARIFGGKKWTEIDLEKSSYPGPISEIPGLLTDEAAAHFFPFFIRCVSESPGWADSLAEALLFRLLRDIRDGGNMKRCFDMNQRKLISKFIKNEFQTSKSYRADLEKTCRFLAEE